MTLKHNKMTSLLSVIFLVLLSVTLTGCKGTLSEKQSREVLHQSGENNSSQIKNIKLSDNLSSACASLKPLLEKALKIPLQLEYPAIVEEPFAAPDIQKHYGCKITGVDETDRGIDPMSEIDKRLRENGWVVNWDYSADGPDGSVVGYKKNGIKCIVTGSWDGGDDTDPSYIPVPGYKIEIICFE